MSDRTAEFDPESSAEREVAGEAAHDSDDFLSLMGHTYRGEMARMTAWRTRIDRTTNWAVVVTATLLTWAFSSHSRPHYLLLVGIVMVTVFLSIEVRRYRVYDIWRSRIRILEENVFANALDPAGVEQSAWRTLLSEDLRDPAIKTPVLEATTRRLRRVYFALISVLVGSWIVRITVFATTDVGIVGTARIGRVPGGIVLALVGSYYAAMSVLRLRPSNRQAKGELQIESDTEAWR